jgi:hypothetical protein
MKDKRVRAKWFIHRNYLTIVAIVFLATVALAVVLYLAKVDWKISFPILGSLFSFIYFIQKQQLDEARLFKDLFVEFNKRYDDLNGKLNDILRGNSDSMLLSSEEMNTLYDYFNLCAEEYLFYCKGFIYPEVWRDWVKGMKIYFGDSRIKKLWSDEIKTESYYGLNVFEEIQITDNPSEA